MIIDLTPAMTGKEMIEAAESRFYSRTEARIEELNRAYYFVFIDPGGPVTGQGKSSHAAADPEAGKRKRGGE